MADFLHLDAAAKAVGKSEVTLRRLIKAEKIPYHKEKTVTGFLYLVRPEDVLAYYDTRTVLNLGSDPEPRAEIEPDKPKPAPKPKVPVEPQPEPAEPTEDAQHAVTTRNGSVRVAISDEQGNPVDYWAKRAETYEERYHEELQRTSDLREELGLWRGRAEHAQALLMKLLPSAEMLQVTERRQTPEQTVTVRRLTFAGMIILIALPTILIIGAFLVYFLVLKK